MCAQCGDKKRSEEIYIKAFTQTHREICVISFKKYIHLINFKDVSYFKMANGESKLFRKYFEL